MDYHQQQIIPNRYQIRDILGQGGMGIVYYTYDRLTQTSIALKRVLADSSNIVLSTIDRRTSSDFYLLLAQEFQTLASLRHPNIISVLDYGFDDQQTPFFTMQYIPNGQTLLNYGIDLPVAHKIDLIVDVLRALQYLHRHQIIHRDLKPANILIDEAGMVRVLDFGLAITTDTRVKAGGTLAYMAPEQMMGRNLSFAADLYAVGVLAYELLATQHPFESERHDTRRMIAATLRQTVDMAPLIEQTNDAIAQVIFRFVAKKPEDRPADAYNAIEQLCAAAKRPVPEESHAIQRSYLTRARFIGRKRELTQLDAALKETFRSDTHTHQQAQWWWLGGESGVGKSRLLDEVRVRALVRGVRVLQGQAIADQPGTYTIWRGILPELILNVAVQDPEASVLHAILPDIGLFLGREIEPAAPLPGAENLQRLIDTLIAVMRRHNKPILLLLEDLQWAQADMPLLQAVFNACRDLPLMVIGSYRTDEAPDLPDSIKDAHTIRLDRFTPDEMAQLSAAILGETGQDAQLLQWLTTQTEGNAFFTVDMLQTLAQEAAQLHDIEQIILPDSALTHNMRQIAWRRFNRLPQDDHAPLQLAAIIGRELDFDLMQHITKQADFTDWIQRCYQAAIIDPTATGWRFTHDKVRESILFAMDSDTRRNFHQQVAQALEALHADDREIYGRLAHHWLAAEAWNTGAGYMLDYAEYSFQHMEDLRVKPQIENLRRLIPHLTFENQIKTYAYLAYLRAQDDQVAQAELYWQQALTLAQQHQKPDLEADILIRLAIKARNLQQWQEAEQNLQRSWAIYQRINDAIGLCKTAIQLSNLVASQRDGHKAVQYAQQAFDIATEHELQEDWYNIISTLANAYLWANEPDIAETYCLQALQIAEETKQPHGKITIYTMLGLIYQWQGRFDEADDYAQQALDLAIKTGNRRRQRVMLLNMATSMANRGNYQESEQRYKDVLVLAHETNDRLIIANACGALAQVQASLGKWQDVRETLLQWLKLLPTTNELLAHFHGLYAAVDWALYQGRPQVAARWLGMILQYAYPTHQDEAELNRLRETLTNQLTHPDEIESLIDIGRQWALDAIAADVREQLNLLD